MYLYVLKDLDQAQIDYLSYVQAQIDDLSYVCKVLLHHRSVTARALSRTSSIMLRTTMSHHSLHYSPDRKYTTLSAKPAARFASRRRWFTTPYVRVETARAKR